MDDRLHNWIDDCLVLGLDGEPLVQPHEVGVLGRFGAGVGLGGELGLGCLEGQLLGDGSLELVNADELGEVDGLHDGLDPCEACLEALDHVVDLDERGLGLGDLAVDAFDPRDALGELTTRHGVDGGGGGGVSVDLGVEALVASEEPLEDVTGLDSEFLGYFAREDHDELQGVVKGQKPDWPSTISREFFDKEFFLIKNFGFNLP